MLQVCGVPQRHSVEEFEPRKPPDKLEPAPQVLLPNWIRLPPPVPTRAANTAIDQIRKSKKDPMLTDNDEDFKLGTEDKVVEQEELESLEIRAELAMEAIQQLSPAYRAVFNLYVMEEYTHKEIAEILGISEGTSKSNLAKAKMNLQKILKEKFQNVE